MIRAENLILSDTYFEKIIVGSSLSVNLNYGQFDHTWSNLSFSGLSIYEGLEIIHHLEQKPKYLFIEINVLLRDKDTFFLEHLFNPIKYPIKKKLSILKESQQPVSLIGEPLLYHLIRKLMPSNKSNNNPKIVDIKKELVQKMSKDYDIVPIDKIQNQIALLKKLLTPIENHGTKVILFEMPIDQALCNTPLTIAIRQAIKNAFPQYFFIEHPDCTEYSTSDGIHLDHDSALKFVNYFKDKIQQI
ncbi:hypothetical protein AAOP42_20410 [Reichenbachiella sp. MALMAid0571]